MEPNLRTRDRLGAEYSSRLPAYELMAEVVLRILRSILRHEGLVVHSIRARLKTFESFYLKIDKKGITGDPFEHIDDIVGCRIICTFREDKVRIERLLRENFEVLEAQNKASEERAQQVGYRSRHFVVRLKEERLALPEYRSLGGIRCELQLRTILQDAWAEVEHHLAYKSNMAIPKRMRAQFRQLSKRLDEADEAFQELRRAKQKLQKSLETRKALMAHGVDIESVTSFIRLHFTRPHYQKLDETPDYSETFTNDVNWLIGVCHDHGVTTIRELDELFHRCELAALLDRFHTKMRRAGERFYYRPCYYLATVVMVEKAPEEAMRLFHSNTKLRYPAYHERKLADVQTTEQLTERLREVVGPLGDDHGPERRHKRRTGGGSSKSRGRKKAVSTSVRGQERSLYIGGADRRGLGDPLVYWAGDSPA